MPAVDNLDFLNTNTLRNYPIKEGKTRVSTNGVFTIPNDFIVDMQLAATYDPEVRFYISRISNFEDSISIEISDNENVLVGSFLIIPSNHWQYKDYFLTPTEEYVGTNGIITITGLKTIKAVPSGSFSFSLETAELEARVSVPSQKSVNRLVFINNNGNSFFTTGDVRIVARSNIRFKLDEEDSNTVIIDVGNGLGLNTECDGPTKCIKTINGIPPDEDSNFTLDFSDCATLTPIPANTGLLLEDICCKPCMGCNDIEELTTRLMTTENGLVALRQYYSDLERLFTDFKTTQTYSCDCPPES
jgi:hypothetical protein